MSQTGADALLGFVREHAGSGLRSVVRYGPDRLEVLHLRRDVADRYSDREREAVLEDLRWTGLETARQEDLYDLGDLDCTLRCFNHGVVMHFPLGEDAGLAISVDLDAMAGLLGFVGELRQHLYRRSSSA